MQKSETIALLAKALSAFQGEVQDAPKTTKGHNYMYARLDEMLSLSRPLLAKNGLSVSQFCGTADEKISVETVLMHESGEWMSGVIEMGLDATARMNKAQAVGSVITYARRYSLGAVLGFTTKEDDTDANPIDDRGNIVATVIKAVTIASKANLATVQKIEALWYGQYDPTKRDNIMNEWLKVFKVKRLNDISQTQADQLLTKLKDNQKKKEMSNV